MLTKEKIQEYIESAFDMSDKDIRKHKLSKRKIKKMIRLLLELRNLAEETDTEVLIMAGTPHISIAHRFWDEWAGSGIPIEYSAASTPGGGYFDGGDW